MKTDNFPKSSLLLLIVIGVSVNCQIIGSSVVTSVSVLLGDENKDDLQSTTRAIEAENTVANSPSSSSSTATPPSSSVNAKPEGEGVNSVIATLKDIVEKEQEKHDQSKSSSLLSSIMSSKRPTSTIVLPHSTNNRPSSSVTAKKNSPSSTRLEEEDSEEHDDDDDDSENDNDNDTENDDDDDDDDDEADDFVDVKLSPTTTAATNTIATLAATSLQPSKLDNTKSGNAENDTATSAEVNEAIQKISGALLTPKKGEKNKPIENIVTDVLTSINDARNGSTTATVTPPTTTSTTTAKTTTTKSPSTLPPSTTTNAPLIITGFTTTTKKPIVTTTTGTTTASTTTTTTRRMTTTIRPKPNQEKETAQQQQQASLHIPPARTGLRTTLPPDPTPAPTTTMMVIKHKNKISEIGKQTTKLPGIQTDDNVSTETETEEDFFMDNRDTTESMQHQQQHKNTQNRVKPTKTPLLYSTVKKQNVSSSSTRPTDFYDDEIFGYDPYQTFLHGVYVPIVEIAEGEDNRDGIMAPMNDATTTRPMMMTDDGGQYHSHNNHGGFRPNLKSGGSSTGSSQASTSVTNRKPVPSLPDHLHRPRPTHIQYQHGAAEDVDSETGMLAIKRPMTQPTAEENFAVDRLQSQPRPPLPRPVVENFTNYHNEAHHGGGHGGHGGAHGHHGNHGHGEGHDGHSPHHHAHHGDHGGSEKRPTFSPAPPGNPGLEATVTNADPEMRQFIDINNRLALRIFSSVTNPISKSSSAYNNMVLSPFTIISSLAMMFLGARGSTAQQLDGLLQLDDMLTFNPHMLYNNVTQSFLSQPNTAAALIRLLIADKSKGDVLEFFKTRVQHFYDARVEEADYKFAGHLAQSIINQMTRAQIQRHSYEMLNYSLPLTGPMSLLTSAFFDGQFSSVRDQSVDNMDFIHLAALGASSSRRLISVPAVAFKDSLRAAYDKDLDATAVEVPYSTRDLSLILIMPGRPGEFSIGGLSSLKSRLTLESWHSLMRGFYPRDPFKVVFPRFRHQSTLNLTYTMQRLGLTDMFSPSMAKFKGVNGLTDLSLDQNMIHFSEFGTWEKLSDTLTESNNQQNSNKNLDLIRILRPHVREHYGNYGSEPMSVNDWIFMSRNPSLTVGQRVRSNSNNPRPRSTNNNAAPHSNHQIYPRVGPSYTRIRSSRAQQQKFKDALLSSFNPSRTMSKIYYFRQEQTNNEPETVLRFERPFLYILRHNPTGMIITTGQYLEPVTDEERS